MARSALAKDLYNRCNYILRQCFFSNERLPNISMLIDELRILDCFHDVGNTKISKHIIRKCLIDWTNYFKGLREYKRSPSKFSGKPKPPKYKKKYGQLIFDKESIKLGRSKKDKTLEYIEASNECFKVKSNRKYKQIIITPKNFGFMIDIFYESEEPKPKTVNKNKQKYCVIDPGVNNLLTITSDQHIPILINGCIVKSFNQEYNKKKTKKSEKKRYFRIENYFHHTSKFIIDNCIKYGITTIIIGRNNGWKKNIKMRRNQKENFKYIPFEELFNKIKYKAALAGIEVVFIEESYTSKASFLDKDFIPTYDKNNNETYEFSGKRIKRGLYKSKDGTIINADCNGSGNIGRKSNIIPNINSSEWDRSVAATPVKVNSLRAFGSIGRSKPRTRSIKV